MSFLGSLFGAAAPIIGGFFGPAGAAVGSAIGGAVQGASERNAIQRAQAVAAFSPQVGVPNISLGGGPPLVPVRGSVPLPITGPASLIGRALGAEVACGTGFHPDKKTRTRCVRNRRMNPLNGRAASRAIRRIKGARKMLQKIERSLPRAKARAVPRHGHRVHVESR